MPVTDLLDVLTDSPAIDSVTWRSDLAAAQGIFAPDEPFDPFEYRSGGRD